MSCFYVITYEKKAITTQKVSRWLLFPRVLISYLLKTFWVSFTLKYHYICNDILVLMGVSFKNNLKLGSLSDYLY